MTTAERIIETEKRLARISEIASAPFNASQRPEVGSTDGTDELEAALSQDMTDTKTDELEALTGKWERRIEHLENRFQHTNCDEDQARGIQECVDDLRAYLESASPQRGSSAIPPLFPARGYVSASHREWETAALEEIRKLILWAECCTMKLPTEVRAGLNWKTIHEARDFYKINYGRRNVERATAGT